MADLKKWFPFMFNRNKGEAGQESPSAAPVKAEAAVPVRSPGMGAGWPASPFADMNRLMQQMFADPFFRQPASLLRQSDAFFGDFSPDRFAPSVDITDQGETVKVTAELPGMDRDDVKLEVHDGVILLSGSKKHEESKEEEGCYRTERYFGSFSRRIPLPRDLKFDAAEASFDKGVLTVQIPKVEPPTSPQKIEVKGS